MKKNEELQQRWKKILWYVGCIIIVMATVAWYKVFSYDTEAVEVDNTTTKSKVTVEMYSDINSTNSWKTQLQLSEDPADYVVLVGSTCSAEIRNGNKHNINNWYLRIDIQQECYLNNFWCGSVEVHQFRNEQEFVDLVNMNNLDTSKLSIERNEYSVTTMIHLMPGDYLIYYPSVSVKEDVVEGESTVGIGFIFYYKGTMDLSSFYLNYKNDLRIKDDVLFMIVLYLIMLWIAAFLIYLYLSAVIKRMRQEMNSQIRNMSIMADMYQEVYLINSDEDTAILIKGDEDNLFWKLEGRDVQEKINRKICDSCDETYYSDLIQFLNLNTVKDRMKGASRISFEWVDENMGWCSVLLFCVGEKSNQIVFALQDINEEKRKINAVEERIRMAEFTQVVNGSFIGTIAFALNDIANRIGQTGEMLRDKVKTEEGALLADGVISGTKHMVLLQNTLFDMFALESGRFTLNEENYNLHDMIKELIHLVEPFIARDKYELIVEVDEKIPDSLMGDRTRLEQILVILLFSSLLITPSGYVKISVLGKQDGSEEELIISIRDTAMGFTEAQVKEINAFIRGTRIESFDNASLVYLKIINDILGYMNSELKVVSVQGEGSDFYFSIKQKIV